MTDNEFYDNWGEDYEDGYNMTEEEWEEMHRPYNEREDWKFEDE